MKRFVPSWRAWLLVGCLGIYFNAGAEEPDWIPLFDGKSLDGWKANERGGFSVVDGAITFSGERSHLFYTGPVRGAGFKNLELRAEVKTQKGANSGIFFHTAWQESNWLKQGFEVQVANTHVGHGGYVEMKKTGSLYGVRNVYKALAKDGEWFRLHLSVRGKRVQVRLNEMLTVDYIEPQNPPISKDYPGRKLGRGTFALQGHDPESKVWYRTVEVKPLPDDLPEHEGEPAIFDAIDTEIVRLAGANYPLVDFHTHLKGGLTVEQVLEHTRKTGIYHGIAVNCGVGFSVTNDAGIDAFLASMAGQPVFLGMQAEGREWTKLFSPAAVARFDYVFTDSMTITDQRGKRSRLWIPEEVHVPDPESFMDHLVKSIEEILDQEPVDIYVNPTFLPDVIAGDYEKLWTAPRMERVIAALKRNGVAMEINSRLKLPGERFIKMGKAAGLKFTMGVNNTGAELGRSEYAIQMIRDCGLNYQDFWMPKPEGQKPVQTKGMAAR